MGLSQFSQKNHQYSALTSRTGVQSFADSVVSTPEPHWTWLGVSYRDSGAGGIRTRILCLLVPRGYRYIPRKLIPYLRHVEAELFDVVRCDAISLLYSLFQLANLLRELGIIAIHKRLRLEQQALRTNKVVG